MARDVNTCQRNGRGHLEKRLGILRTLWKQWELPWETIKDAKEITWKQ
jgi:hypothetical protein